jgi:16S rRNA (uracil1498-N3)-methyltransferase
MSNRFYVNYPLAAGRVSLEGSEARHLASVRRLRPGDPVCLFNGDGHEYSAIVVACARKSVELNVAGVASPQRELPFHLEVAAPLPKGDRAQFLLEKLTELGVAAFVPLRTVRSVVHPGETRLEKMQRHVIEASKQCGRNVLMQVASLTQWQDYCGRTDLPPIRILAHPQSHDDLGTVVPLQPQGLALAVGPEGGFTDEEISAAQSHGWRTITLGPRILRVETAAIALTAWASLGHPGAGRVNPRRL